MPARTQQRESPKPERMASFAAIVKQAAEPAADGPWWFVVLPRDVSERLPRRGRTSVQGRINGAPFLVTLEPDGKLSHWLKIDKALLKAARATAGSEASVELSAVEQEPEPQVPAALQRCWTHHPMRSPPGTQPPRWHALTGSTGSNRQNSRARAASAQSMPRPCLPPARGGFAALIRPDTTQRACALRKGRSEQVLSRAISLPPLLDFVGASLLATIEFRTCSEFPKRTRTDPYPPARMGVDCTIIPGDVPGPIACCTPQAGC